MNQPSNRLAREKSPYLQQHAHNPVDWFPWGEEAFQKAREERKPILLSIGYSTCHWCHVMERESFENPDVALFLNAHYVSIKVDREERPDVDRIYMFFAQATSGGGGWPLNCFLTPDLKPFYAGTYFPPEERYGRPSFLAVLEHIHELWQAQPEKIGESARQMHERLTDAVVMAPDHTTRLSPVVLEQAGAQLQQGYDAVHGGFGSAPKFPHPCQPLFLLRYARRFQDPETLRRVLHTCDCMAAGGIHDQLGGGFARYAVDAEWLVPHFEKMLYDNAQLVELYLEAFLLSGEPRHAAIVRDILAYLARDMTHPAGGFYSAEDADSEGHEGKFYCWTRAELARLLSPEEFNVAVAYYGITEAGNFTDHSRPDPLSGQNILYLANPAIPSEDLPLLQSSRQKMFRERCQRVRPHRDDKILASWNGLILGALARAGVVLRDDSYLAAAEKNLSFVRTALWDEATRTLSHRWREGERDSVQLLSAYAFLLHGVLQFYECTLRPAHLEFALALAETMLHRFYDPDHGGFWQSDPTTADLILRLKETYDSAEPAGNSVAILALLKLAAITGRADFKQAAEKSLLLFADLAARQPQAVPFLLGAVDFWLDTPVRLVVAGEPTAPGTHALLHAAHSVYRPNKVVLGNTGPVEPFARALPLQDHQPTAYLCVGQTCELPLTVPEGLRQRLER